MILTIHHTTEYAYEDQVFLNPHHFYFRPVSRDHFVIKSFILELNPYAALSQRLDGENNIFHQAWFTTPTDSLKIQAKIEIELTEVNPFNFLIEEEQNPNPMLEFYKGNQQTFKAVDSWVQNQDSVSGGDLLTFLTYLNKEIFQNWLHKSRYSNDLLSPEVCFENKEGACRDLANMMMYMLRSQGIPSRFVSGYSFNPFQEEGQELHAWVEAYVPGAGWVGLDPSAGLITNHYYIPVTSSYLPSRTLPVQGTYLGKPQNTMETEVRISLLN